MNDLLGKTETSKTADAMPALWNPAAACNWSLLFTPVFGAFLQFRNWETLGEPVRARRALFWAGGLFLVFFIWVLLPPEWIPMPALAKRFQLVMLAIWYFAEGRSQIRHVRECYGKQYPRKSWGIPLLIGVGALVLAILLRSVGSVEGLFR